MEGIAKIGAADSATDAAKMIIFLMLIFLKSQNWSLVRQDVLAYEKAGDQ